MTVITSPQPIDGFVSSRVITMGFVTGAKLTDVSPVVLLELDAASMANELFRVYLHQSMAVSLMWNRRDEPRACRNM